MKKIYLLSILSLVSMTLWSQTKTWTGDSDDWTQGNNWFPEGVPTATSNVVFNSGNDIEITNVPTINLNRITVTAGTTVSLRGIPGGSTITLNNGSGVDLAVNTGSSLIMGNNFNLAFDNGADATIAGVLDIGVDRTYQLGNGNSNTIVTGTIHNRGIINHSPSSVLAFSNGGIYLHDQNGGVVPEATWHDNSNCNIIGVTTTMPTNFDQNFGNFEWDASNQTAALSFGGNLGDIDGDLKITSTGTGSTHLANSVANHSITVAGDYIQTGGIFVITQTSGNGTLELLGNFNMSGGTLAKNSPAGVSLNTIIFGNNGVQTFTKTGGTISGSIDFEVASGSAVDFGTSILDGSTGTFRLQSGGKMITSHPAGLNSTGAVGSIQVANRVFNEQATYEFRGPVTGVFNTGASTNGTPSLVSNLIINNASGAVTLSKPVTVANNLSGTQRLYLQNGALITTATNILTLNNDVQATGVPGLAANQYNLNSFVDGPMRKIGDDDFIFPVGKAGTGLHKIGIDITGVMNNTTSFTAQYFRADPNTLGTTLGAGLTKISSCEYWTLDRTGTNQARVILSWESNSGCSGAPYVMDPLTLSVARLNGAGTWVDEGRLTSTGNNTAGTITSGNIVNNFSPFALASSSASNPLPVVFGDVKAYEKNNGVQIDWSNLTEKDVVEYTIERSLNGQDFEPIATQWPTSNQDDRAYYTAFDANPTQSTNYYRIKVVETTGKIVYSRILSININKAALGLILYPNPVKDKQITISLSNVKRGSYNMRVVNATGQDIFRKTILNQSSSFTQTVDLPASLKPGVYNMIITADDYRQTKMFIVQ